METTRRFRIATLAGTTLLAAHTMAALMLASADGRQSLLPWTEGERRRGSVLLTADAGAPAAPSAETDDSDPRLRQTVVMHAHGERIADVLAGLSKATGVALLARMEVADEVVTFWTEGQPLMDVMRDLRHLRGLYWSRAKRGGEWVYSLWQDAQSQAREEAEAQRWAIEQQRDFARRIQQRVQALSADDAALKQLGKDDAYLIVQMKHPVVKNGYRLFASLSPDQQAQLTQGQTPSRGLSFGELMDVAPYRSKPGDPYFNPDSYADQYQPHGDMVTLGWGEMTALQRGAVTALLKGASQELEAEARREKQRYPDEPKHGEYFQINARAIAAALPETATLTFFRWGDPAFQGLSAHVTVKSGGRDWFVYSNLASTHSRFEQDVHHEALIRGERLWRTPEEAERLLAEMRKEGVWRSRTAEPPVFDPKPDPVLDAPISFTWTLPLRENGPKNAYKLVSTEVMAALSQTLGRPIVVDGGPHDLQQPKAEGDRFRWKERPVRELLERLFSSYRGHVREGTIFLYQPERLRERLYGVPPAVRRFLDGMKGPYTLEDMTLLARSLSPWQIVKLQEYLPNVVIDELLAAQPLLNLYGELSPEQRAALANGLPFSALTPPQQALFLRLAQQQRPFVEPWRFQQGKLRMTLGASPSRDLGRNDPSGKAMRASFEARFSEEDAAAFPIDLVPLSGRTSFGKPVERLVGKDFPGFWENNRRWPGRNADPVWQPALGDKRLRDRAAVIVIARAYVEPYVGTQPAPSTLAWARDLAGRLQPLGLTVAHVTVGPRDAAPPAGAPGSVSSLDLTEPGDVNGEPFDSSGRGQTVPQSPTVFLVDRGGIVRAVIEGPLAWDTAAVERAARALAVPHETAGIHPPPRGVKNR
jgi:hypothetical protein